MSELMLIEILVSIKIQGVSHPLVQLLFNVEVLYGVDILNLFVYTQIFVNGVFVHPQDVPHHIWD